ncbi:hypothetical protein LINPERHAP2_LOCUS8086 [Linum perenne]
MPVYNGVGNSEGGNGSEWSIGGGHYHLESLTFMNSTTSGAFTVSCASGNKNKNNNSLFFCWILFCLLPKFLGTPIVYVSFLLIKAIDRSSGDITITL